MTPLLLVQEFDLKFVELAGLALPDNRCAKGRICEQCHRDWQTCEVVGERSNTFARLRSKMGKFYPFHVKMGTNR
jgi:hypothetical protein